MTDSTDTHDFLHQESSQSNHSVTTQARIACYDNLLSAPRITLIEPLPPAEFIEALASTTYQQSHEMGGTIPYTTIRELCENFIHAHYQEIIVSILENGTVIRFSDQGPGIKDVEKAQLPGYSSATKEMKQYIRGVGSGLPLVKEYLEFSQGALTIETNIGQGTVITINSKPQASQDSYSQTSSIHPTSTIPQTISQQYSNPYTYTTQSFSQKNTQVSPQIIQGTQAYYPPNIPPQVMPMVGTSDTTYTTPPQAYGQINQQGVYPYTMYQPIAQPIPQMEADLYPDLNTRHKDILILLYQHNHLRLSDISNKLEKAASTTSRDLQALQELGLVESTGKIKSLTQQGRKLAQELEDNF